MPIMSSPAASGSPPRPTIPPFATGSTVVEGAWLGVISYPTLLPAVFPIISEDRERGDCGARQQRQ